MNQDLITNNFTDSINKNLLKKLLILSKIVLSLIIIYSIIELFNWYIFISKYFFESSLSYSNYYASKIQPLIVILLLLIAIAGWFYNVKSITLINKAIENSNPEMFNKGYLFVYKTAKLAVISICLSIISAAIRLFLKI